MIATEDNSAGFSSYHRADADSVRVAEHGADAAEAPLALAAANESGPGLLIEQLNGALWTTDTQLCLTSWYGIPLGERSRLPLQVTGLSLSELFGSSDADLRLFAAHQAALDGVAGTAA